MARLSLRIDIDYHSSTKARQRIFRLLDLLQDVHGINKDRAGTPMITITQIEDTE